MSYLGTLNSLLTSTTSRYASLRRNLTSSSEDDSNITDPEDSHVSRVLRAYYTEKGRPFPAWLGTDPREAARAQQKENPYVTSRPMGSLRGNSSTSDPAERPGQARGLSDIWSDSPGSGGQSQGEERGGLRRAPLGKRRLGAPPQAQQQQETLHVRPLPSQRAGSYQTQNPAYAQQQQLRGDRRNTNSPGPPPGSSGSGSAQERLKARLGRGTSSGSGGGGGEGGDDGRGGQGHGSYATQGLSGWQGRR